MMINWGFFVVKKLGFLEQIVWADFVEVWVDFWKCVLCILDDFGKCWCEWSDNYGFMQVKCEHVLLHTKCLISCLYEIFGFDSLFLICFKSGGFNVRNFLKLSWQIWVSCNAWFLINYRKIVLGWNFCGTLYTYRGIFP